MSDSKTTVRELARALKLSIPEDRWEQVVEAWEQALAEAESIRQLPTAAPATEKYDAAWSQNK